MTTKSLKHLFVVAIVAFTSLSCSKTATTELTSENPLKSQAEACKQFESSMHKLTTAFSTDKSLLFNTHEYVQNEGLRTEKTLSPEDEAKLKLMINEFAKHSDSFLNAFDVQETAELSVEDKLVLCTLLYAEYKDLNGTSVLRAGAITGNHIVDCALSALDIPAGIDLVKTGVSKYIAKYGARAALKTVAKLAGKSLSWIGVGLAVYDFYTCMR